MEKDHETATRPQETSENHLKNDFCIPVACCPERLPSPQLPSPTDCLSQGELEELEEVIRDANELLLDLALEDGRPTEEIFRKVFDGLIDLWVEVINQFGETIEGKVFLVGFDFVALRKEKVILILPYNQIELVKPFERFAELYPDPELTEIDACLRRDLTFHFGKVVSSTPKLIHLFFRMRLTIYLLLLVDKRIRVTVGHSTIEGTLVDADQESILLKQNEEKEIIPIDTVSLITVKS